MLHFPKSPAILFLQIYQSPAGEAKRVPHISAIFQIYDCASKQLKQTTLERLLHVVGAQVACPNSLSSQISNLDPCFWGIVI